MTKLINILLCAVIAVASLTGCRHDNSQSQINEEMRKEMAEAIRAEIISASSLDSLANTPVYVSPSIYVESSDSGVDGEHVLRMLALMIPFAFVIAIIWIVLHYKRQNLLSKYKIIELSIINRQPLPEAFYGGRRGATGMINRKRLSNGMMWIAFGLAGVIFFLCEDVMAMMALCLLPIFIGAAKIVSYFVEQRSIESDSAAENKDAWQA